ncbi:hypothetical protein D3C86_473280 [compost metagenome]
MPTPIDRPTLTDFTRRIDRNGNSQIDSSEAQVLGRVGSKSTREAADALAAGDAALSGFRLGASDAEAIADRLAGGDAWVSKEDLSISDAARDRIDGLAGGAVDGKISKKELAAGLQQGGLALTGDGIMLSREAESRFASRPTPPGGSDRPTPPGSSDRPTPPGGSDRPTPPSGSDRPTPPSGSDRPTPPSGSTGPVPPRVPRYYWQPEMPVLLPNDPQPVPKIALPPEPAPARKIELGDVKGDVVDLLAGYDRLRTKKKTLLITHHPEITASEAKDKLSKGETIYLAPNGGVNKTSAYKPITSAKELDPLFAGVKEQKRGDMQATENSAYQQRVRDWTESDIRNRVNQLPAFNSIYNTDRLALNNLLVTEGGRSFNRNMITAMNIYKQSDTQREIARKWHENPEMSTRDFNRMANAVITDKVSRLYWQADYMGDPEAYLGRVPVPGLRYPDTQEDVDYNVQAIRRVSQELPHLLNSAVNP